MLEALKDIIFAVRELNLGVGGFFALCFMAIFVWGAKRTSEFTSGLSGEWKRLIDEGHSVSEALKKDLATAKALSHDKDLEIDQLRRDYIALHRRYLLLQAEVTALRREQH